MNRELPKILRNLKKIVEKNGRILNIHIYSLFLSCRLIWEMKQSWTVLDTVD